jgi:hypothetical protein
MAGIHFKGSCRGFMRRMARLNLALTKRYEESSIRRYADQAMLDKDIQRVDEIYLWFLKLKEEGLRLTKK